ncbi:MULTISPECIES: ABC transporter substrate-binding protein [Caldilinea]|uniref:ABC transporter substrate-binding protein n=1 Tax=Caldilinea TaxID=233191 RepID=UPI0002F29E81|nr:MULTISPECIES: ABC transporter substrate-binding protein [Caldilinea]GIV74061.1 MAG: ABC transporter substrate-binding protein [Caldilinea sp.]
MKAKRLLTFRRWIVPWIVIALLVSACAPAAPGAPSAPEQAGAPAGEAVTRANTLIFAADMTDIITLDPAVAYEFGGILPVGNMYETLLSFSPGETELQPVLAESWEVSQDGDMWKLTFKLDPNAKFASGNPVTADDVVFSWSRAIDINKSPAFLLTDVCQMTKENIRAVDASTVELKIPGEASPSVCLSVLTFTVAAVVEKAAVEPNMGDDMGESWLNDHSAGSGPYVLDRWERNVSVTLNANPNYWGGTAPAMKRVILQNMPEPVNRQAAIETGDADIIQDVGPEQVAALEGNPDVTLVKGLSTLLVYVAVNASMPPFDNPDARQALRYAINYDNIITLLGGNGELVQEIIPIGFAGHTGKNPFKQDLEKAKELFAKAGVAEGTVIPFTVATGTAPGGVEWATIAASIQADLAQIGITLEIQQLQQSELLTKYRAQELPMLLMNWGPDFPDPDGNATPFANYEARSLAWRNNWNDPQAIELSKQAAREIDPAKRVELYAQLVEYVQNNGPYAILYQPTQIFAVRNNVEGFVYDPNDTPSISLWLIRKK